MSDGTSSTATSCTGSNATTVAGSVSPGERPAPSVVRSPATTCAFVTTTPGRRDPAAPRPGSVVARAARSPSRSTRARAALTAGLIDVPGGGPGFGRRLQRAERRRERRFGDRAAPRREARRAGAGAHRSIAATIVEPRAMRAGQPCAVANDGMIIQSRASTPNTPTAAPATRSQRGSGPWQREDAVHEARRARGRTSGRATPRPGGTAPRPTPGSRPGAAERGDDARRRSGRRSRARPRRRPTRTRARRSRAASRRRRRRLMSATTTRSSAFTARPASITYRAPAGGRG